MNKKARERCQADSVSSRGVAEDAIKRSKDERVGSWERAVKRSPSQIPNWESESDGERKSKSLDKTG